MMPKSKGNAYFIACQKGRRRSGRRAGRRADLGRSDRARSGQAEPDRRHLDHARRRRDRRGGRESRGASRRCCARPAQRGIKVLTWDADANPDARDFFVNQATPQGIGYTLMDHAGRILGGKGEFAIITASLTAANMIEWQKHIEERRASKYPDIKMADLRPCDDLQEKAFERDQHDSERLSEREADHGHLLAGRARRGRSGEAIGPRRRESHRPGPAQRQQATTSTRASPTASCSGTRWTWATSRSMRPTRCATGTLKPGDDVAQGRPAGHDRRSAGDNILLGEPFTFNKSNIDQFDF